MPEGDTAGREHKLAVMRAKRAGDPRPLIAALTDPDARFLAASYLGDLGDPVAIPHLTPLLEANDPAIRMAAAQALGKLEADEAADRLCEIAERDRVSYVRWWAMSSIGKIGAAGKLGSRDVVPLLIAQLDDPEGRSGTELLTLWAYSEIDVHFKRFEQRDGATVEYEDSGTSSRGRRTARRSER